LYAPKFPHSSDLFWTAVILDKDQFHSQ